MDIAERDRLLQSIRTELGSTQSENFALRQEVAALKKALLEGRGASSLASASTSPTTSTLGIGRAGSPALSIRGSDVNLNTAAALSLDDLNLPPPAPLPERSAAEELALRAAAAANASASASTSASNNTLLVPNTQKDLPTSPRLSALGGVGFWGGVSQAGFGGMGMGGGYTPVHTVLMPDLQLGGPAGTGNGMPNPSIGQWVRDVLAANAAVANHGHSDEDSPSSSSREESPRPLQENMNPVMQQAQEENAMQQQQGTAMNWNANLNSNSPHMGFDGFVDMNPFTMKTLDAYRMQLWTRMASSSHPAPHPNQQQHSPPAQSPSTSSSHSPSSIHSSSSYAAQRKALERELASSSPFTLPGPHHQSPPSNNNSNSHSHSPPYLNGLASSLKPAYFVNSNKPNLPSSNSNSSARSGMGSTLNALLAGKHSTPSAFGSLGSASSSAAAWSPPGSPNLNLSKKPSFNASSAKSTSSPSSTAPQPQPTPAQIQQAQNAMYAAALASTASTTLLGRLGGAFWDAFSGSGHPAGGSSTSPSGAQSHAPTVPSGSGASSGGIFGAGLGQGRTNRPWDVDKVRKVLEGKAVVRVVDVDELPSGSASSASHSMGVSTSTSALGSKPVPAVSASSKDDCSVTALLEEGMKSLSLGKK
ncbi:hypothetical protein GYMLUDRAFT_695720 [Collybiopsis luxurians FD-317 M1]|uniref:Uncharacterized protein n=1 Tax=Collybiopsis luxurians FD-317 M1 TaxID=944289 RepID=A0A0D0BSR2_9AGAR|nr:hypothetical protein GYMLUDRAFT_695720 [Collybiopsis luxurians FD-317 M1]